jgi:hypothetical protein
MDLTIKMKGYEVTLIEDYTHCHPELVEGAKGHIVKLGDVDGFVSVRFPSINYSLNNIGWSSLKITDPEHLAMKAEKVRLLEERLPTMKNVVYTRGPLGRFDNIEYDYRYTCMKIKRETCHDKEEGLKILEYLNKNKVPYETVIDPPPKSRKKKTN